MTKVNAPSCQQAYFCTMIATSGTRMKKDAAMLARMVDIYCDDHHRAQDKGDIARRGILQSLDLDKTCLCSECAELLTHGLVKRINCPFDPKPRCKHCPEPCYSDKYRDFVKTVMRYSGLKLIKSGRLYLIWKYIF